MAMQTNLPAVAILTSTSSEISDIVIKGEILIIYKHNERAHALEVDSNFFSSKQVVMLALSDHWRQGQGSNNSNIIHVRLSDILIT